MQTPRFGAIGVAALALTTVSLTACSDSKSKDKGSASDGAEDASIAGDGHVEGDAASDQDGTTDGADTGAQGGDAGQGMAHLVSLEAMFDFGTTTIGSVGMHHMFTIKNDGDAATGSLGAVIAGIDRASFQIAMNDCSAAMLDSGASCTVEVAFIPSASGPLSAELRVDGMAAGVVSVQISGTGLGPAHLAIAPLTHDYGTAPTGSSVAQDYTLTNNGDLASGTITATVVGVDAADFSITADGCSGMMIAAHETCSITLAFSPQTTGAKNATLQVGATPGGSAIADASGIAIQGARLVAVPSSFNYGNAVTGSPGNAQSFTIYDNGASASGPLTVGMISGTDAADFAVTLDACTGIALTPTTTCAVTVTFAPSTIGAKVAQLSISAQPGGVVSIPFNGSGVPAMPLVIMPAMRNYGSAASMSLGMPVPFVIENPNPSPSGIIAASLTGPNANEFEISGDGCTGTRLPRAGTCTLGVAFNPLAVGNKSASLVIAAGPGEGASAPLTGTSIPPPTLGFSVTTYSFGTRDVHTTTSFRFFLRNNGSTPTGPIAIALTGSSDFTTSMDMCTSAILAAGQACSVDVNFSPTTGGLRNATLSAAATPGGASTVAIDGTGNDQFVLTVSTTGSGVGTVTGGGISCAPTCTGTYMDGTMITLTAAPDAVSRFTGWGGACSGTGSCTVTMNQARNVTAGFDLRNFTLAVTVQNRGNASGTVSSAPSGISCAPSCSASYVARTQVMLTASPAPGFAFEGWSGACTGINLTCALNMIQDANVTATFTPYNLAFVTAATFTPGALGGLAGADAACAQAAAGANLPGTYRAWLSTSTVSAVQRLSSLASSPRGWNRIDGRPFTDTLAALQSGQVLWPLRLNETGASYSIETDVMTGTNGDGGSITNLACGDWRQTSASFIYGDATAGTESWTSFGSGSCATAGYHLYCFGTSYTAPVRVTPAPGRIAFLTDGNWAPSGGVSGADALCALEASRANLSGTFRAMIATSNASALSRFDLSGAPWVRPDGIPVVAAAADLASGAPLTAITVRANGGYIGRGFSWTGVATNLSSPGTLASTCRDWSSTSAGDNATVGYETTTTAGAFASYGSEPCSYLLGHLYCLQE
jgi:List-Bact-rpt repeat protein